MYVEVLVKSSSSADEQRASNVGESDVQSPDLFARRKIPRSQKLKQTKQCPFNSVQFKIHEVSPEGIKVTMEEMICERDEVICAG